MNFIRESKGKVFFKVEDKEISRVIKNENEFSYKNKTYFFSKGSIAEVTDELIGLSQEFSRGWNDVANFIDYITMNNQHLTTEETSIPSAPNSATCRATVSGFIQKLDKPETFGVNQYSCGSYFQKAVKIGGGVRGAGDIITKIRYVMSKLAKTLAYNNSESGVYYRETNGTNFSVYGVG